MRLLTRSDFDGLACAVLLKHYGVIDSWNFVNPRDMQDGLVEVTENDVLANVPYVPGCAMWFDHHSSEYARIGRDALIKGEWRLAPSAARIIYEYYGGEAKAPQLQEFVTAVDKVDSGQLDRDDINNPQDWVLLGFLLDPQTGLGRFKEFTIPEDELMGNLIDMCATMSIEEILKNPDVVERIKLYNEQTEKFIDMVKEHTRIIDNVIITDLRGVSNIYVCNRFMIYCLYPEQNVSMWILDGKLGQNCAIEVGYSILNRTCTENIGDLMLRHGGGGHPMVGTCQIANDKAENAIESIIQSLREVFH